MYMKLLKLFWVIPVIIIISYLLFSKTGPIQSAHFKKILLSDPIVPQLNAECTYFKPSRFLGTTNPHLSCQTIKRFDDLGQVVEIERLQNVLELNGWKLTEKYNPKAITYRKDKLRFNAQPYWGRQV